MSITVFYLRFLREKNVSFSWMFARANTHIWMSYQYHRWYPATFYYNKYKKNSLSIKNDFFRKIGFDKPWYNIFDLFLLNSDGTIWMFSFSSSMILAIPYCLDSLDVGPSKCYNSKGHDCIEAWVKLYTRSPMSYSWISNK